MAAGRRPPARSPCRRMPPQLLGLAPGDRIRLGDADVTVVGHVARARPARPALARRRTGDERSGRGRPRADHRRRIGVDADGGHRVGAVDADPDRRADLGRRPRARSRRSWDELSRTFRSVSDLDDVDAQPRRTTRSHGDRDRRRACTRSRRCSRSRCIILGAIAVIALLELARLLAGVRADETELLWSRGASASAVMRSTALEAALAAMLGAVIGTAAAACALALAGRAGWTPCTSAGVARGSCRSRPRPGHRRGLRRDHGFRAARRPLGRDTAIVSGRARSIAGAGGVGAGRRRRTGISTWQLAAVRLAADPDRRRRASRSTRSPCSRPALALVAIVLVGPRRVPAGRAARRARGTQRHRALRGCSRRAASRDDCSSPPRPSCSSRSRAGSSWSGLVLEHVVDRVRRDRGAQVGHGAARDRRPGWHVGGRQRALIADAGGVTGDRAGRSCSTSRSAGDFASLVSATPEAIARSRERGAGRVWIPPPSPSRSRSNPTHPSCRRMPMASSSSSGPPGTTRRPSCSRASPTASAPRSRCRWSRPSGPSEYRRGGRTTVAVRGRDHRSERAQWMARARPRRALRARRHSNAPSRSSPSPRWAGRRRRRRPRRPLDRAHLRSGTERDRGARERPGLPGRALRGLRAAAPQRSTSTASDGVLAPIVDLGGARRALQPRSRRHRAGRRGRATTIASRASSRASCRGAGRLDRDRDAHGLRARRRPPAA